MANEEEFSGELTVDYKQSAQQFAPDGRYRLIPKSIKKGVSKAQNDMIIIEWDLTDPPSGVQMEDIERCRITSFISLTPKALFTLRNLLVSVGQPGICTGCQTEYDLETHEQCPQCGSYTFTCDIRAAANKRPYAFIENTVYNNKPVNNIKTFLKAE